MAQNGQQDRSRERKIKDGGELPSEIKSRIKRFKQLDVAYGRDNDLTSQMMSLLINDHKESFEKMIKKRTKNNHLKPAYNVRTN